MDRRAMGLLAFGHVTDDINQSFIPAMLPFLIVSLHLTYAAAGTLVLAQAISSSVIQPAIGNLADKRPLPWLIGLGLLLAGGGVALMGIMPTYILVFGAALISGVGVACFHPEAGRFANYVAGPKKASGMRWFAVGGNIGFAIGPLFATAVIGIWGIHGSLFAALPVCLAAALVFFELPRLRTFLPARRKAGTSPEFADDWESFWKLTGFVVLRSACYLGLVAFLPLYAIGVFVSFTLSQSGMIVHHIKLKEKGCRARLDLSDLRHRGDDCGRTARRSLRPPRDLDRLDGKCRGHRRRVRLVYAWRHGAGRARLRICRTDRLCNRRLADIVHRAGSRISAEPDRHRDRRHDGPHRLRRRNVLRSGKPSPASAS